MPTQCYVLGVGAVVFRSQSSDTNRGFVVVCHRLQLQDSTTALSFLPLAYLTIAHLDLRQRSVALRGSIRVHIWPTVCLYPPTIEALRARVSDWLLEVHAPFWSESVEPKRLRDKAHLKFVALQPYLIFGRRPCDPHHLRFAQPRAIGLKVSDEFTIPLCRGHHHQLHQAGNERSWWAERKTMPLKVLEQQR